MTLSDRIAVFSGGEVMQIGKPDEIYERPQNAFTAEFLGATNFLSGRAGQQQGDVSAILLGDDQQILTLDPLPQAGAPVTLTVRPEKLALHSRAPGKSDVGDATNCIAGQVVQPIYMGASITYQILAGGSEITVFHQNRESRMLQPGAPVWLTWHARHSILIDHP